MRGKQTTYQDLLDALLTVPKERLLDNITVLVSHEREYYSVRSILKATDYQAVLDKGHVYLEI